MTHFLDAVMFWVPVYRLNALIRLITATASMLTVYYLIKILPQAFRLKTTEELEKEVLRRIQAEEKLAEANASLTSFAYIASHDLQEPVRKIKFYASQLSELYNGKLDSAGTELVGKILKSGTRMQTMTTDILTLSGYSDQITMGMVNLQDAIDISLQDLDNRIRETGAQITVGPLPEVYGNLSYLAHLFLNLLSNSLKFSKVTPIVKIWGESSGNSANIYVEDNGIGIPNDGQQKIFYAFQRIHGRSEYEGSGLGLAICKRILDVHQGSISVHSLVNEGSTFVVTIPRVKPEEKDAEKI
jgi:light-regulated signal transduction histidine kinase (bacteriophytochrome)